MSIDVPAWFQQEFQSDVHFAYQRKGARLRNTVRTKKNVRAEKTHFNLASTVGVGDKARGANVPVISGERSRVPCDLHAKFGGDYVEDLDEIMSSVEEKRVIAESFAWAHGRHSDDLIITQLNRARQTVGTHATGLTKGLIQEALATLNAAEVPDDGQRTVLVTPRAWEELLNIEAFANADYIGEKALPWLGGSEAKRWRNCLWLLHTGLPTTATQATCLLYHKTAVGHAIGKELTSTWSWENAKSAWFLNTRMLQGAALIDEKGVVKLKVKNDTKF